MPDSTPLPAFAAIVLAAGKGSRAGQSPSKQFARWRGKPLIRHSVETLLAGGASPMIVAMPQGGQEEAQRALDGLEGVEFVLGGATRQQSVRAALEYLSGRRCTKVLIHDAARPVIPGEVIGRLLATLDETPGAIPVLPLVDSLAVEESGMMAGGPAREQLRRVQTPQGFDFEAILAAHRAWRGEPVAGDDAQVLRAAGGRISLVEGDERMKKLTFAEDFAPDRPAIRSGIGFDVHRLVAGEELWLAGIHIEYEKGLTGHSDADVALHAITDALLGAVGEGDIGAHFPPSDSRWKDASSDKFLVHAAELVAKTGYRVGNVDLTIICEAPRIGPHRAVMCERIADLLGVDIGRVSVKATTTERLGLTGRREGIAAQAIATVIRD